MGLMGPMGPISLSFSVEKEPATNGERAEAVVRQQLAKLGDTPFEATEVEVRWSQPYFLPAATLNSWRREAVNALEAQLRVKSEELRVIGPMSHIGPMSPIGQIETSLPNALMTCKYCILHELDCCKRLHPKKSGVPTFLKRDNLLLRIETDCKNCIMKLTKAC